MTPLYLHTNIRGYPLGIVSEFQELGFTVNSAKRPLRDPAIMSRKTSIGDLLIENPSGEICVECWKAHNGDLLFYSVNPNVPKSNLSLWSKRFNIGKKTQ